MKAVFAVAAVVGISMALPPWEAVGPEGSGYGLMSLTQSYTDPATLYSVGGPVAAGNYIMVSSDSGGNWSLFSAPTTEQNHPALMALTPDGTIIFSFSAQGQIGRSTDNGSSWQWVDVGGGAFSSRLDMVTLPGSSGAAWAVGRGQLVSGGNKKAFFWKTSDSGLSWSHQDLITTSSEVFRVSVCAADANVLYTAGIMNTAPRIPLLMKTVDGGTNWAIVTPSQCIGSDSTGLGTAVSPVDPSLVLFSTRNNIYRSTDGGQSWAVVSSGDWMLDIEFSPADPDLVFASGRGSILRSTDAGLSWSTVFVGTPTDTVRTVVPSRDSPDMVFASSSGGFLCSDDGGMTWYLSNAGMMMVRTSGLASSQGASPRLYMVCDGELCASDDMGFNCFPLTMPSGMNTYSLDILVDPFNKDNIVCLNFNGAFFHSADGGFTWTVDASTLNNGRAVASDPSNQGVLYLGGSRDVAGEDRMCLGTSDDGGSTWSFQDLGDSQATILTIAIDPVHPDTIYVAGNYENMAGCLIQRSFDGGSSWQQVQTSIHQNIFDLSVSPDDPGLLLACANGGLYRSTNFGATWTLILDQPYPQTAFFDPYFPQRAWCLNTVSAQGVLLSEDAGLTWEQWNEGLLTWRGVNSLVFVSEQWLYSSTMCAVFRLDLLGQGTADAAVPEPVQNCPLSVTPNPVPGSGTIRYNATAGETVEFTVFDLAGRVVARFTETPVNSGMNTFFWNPRNDASSPLSSGVFFIRMRAVSGDYTTRAILVESPN